MTDEAISKLYPVMLDRLNAASKQCEICGSTTDVTRVGFFFAKPSYQAFIQSEVVIVCKQCVRNKRIRMLKSAFKIFGISVPLFLVFTYVVSSIMPTIKPLLDGFLEIIVGMIWIGSLAAIFISIFNRVFSDMTNALAQELRRSNLSDEYVIWWFGKPEQEKALVIKNLQIALRKSPDLR